VWRPLLLLLLLLHAMFVVCLVVAGCAAMQKQFG
jgi:hypothetical protein